MEHSIAENSPILLGGDFNAHHPLFNDPTSYRPLLKDPPGIHIEHHLSNSLHIQILNKTKATHIRGGVLDLTFTNDYLASNANSSFHEHLNSDHSALIITIEIPRMNSPPYQPKWNTHKANWGRFQKLIEIWASSYQIGDKTLDKLEEDFKTAITEAANSAIPLCKPFSKEHQDHWYYSNRVAELHHRVNITKKNLSKFPSKGNLDLYRDTLRHVKRELWDIRTEKWLAWCETLNSHTKIKDIWSHLRKATGCYRTNRIPAHPDPQGEANKLINQFATRSSSSNLDQNTVEALAINRPLQLHIIENAIEDSDDTDHPITMAEINKAINIHKISAPGDDKISYGMMKHLGPKGMDFLLHLYNKSYKERKNTGTSDNIATLRSMLDQGKATLVFLDLEKAFELADPIIISTILAEKGVKGHLLAWITDYFTQRKATVIFQGHLSNTLIFEKGTPQGGILSPTLFNLLIEKLVNLPFRNNTTLLSYADDLQLITTGPHQLLHAQHALDLITQACTSLGLKINPSKSSGLNIGPSRPFHLLTIQGQNIDWVEKAKCLGHFFSERNHEKDQLDYLKQRIQSRILAMRKLTSTRIGAGYKILRTSILKPSDQ
nr:uncharacterized protein LOC113815373 [Penaeus vannamei]